MTNPSEHLRRLREAIGWAERKSVCRTSVDIADLAWALERLDEAREALRPFKAKWDALRDPLPQGPFSISVDAMTCCRAAAIADKIGVEMSRKWSVSALMNGQRVRCVLTGTPGADDPYETSDIAVAQRLVAELIQLKPAYANPVIYEVGTGIPIAADKLGDVGG
jgi:hypothetical protein